MADTFKLPVAYDGLEKEYPTEILRFGYTHKIVVTVQGIAVTFEPDEEGNYRAMVDPSVTEHIPQGLLQEISETLKLLFE